MQSVTHYLDHGPILAVVSLALCPTSLAESRHGFTVSSTCVRVGGSVTIKGQRGDMLRVLMPGGRLVRIKLDESGRFTLKEPLGKAGTFTISNFDADDPHEIDITVVEAS